MIQSTIHCHICREVEAIPLRAEADRDLALPPGWKRGPLECPDPTPKSPVPCVRTHRCPKCSAVLKKAEDVAIAKLRKAAGT